MTGIEIFCISNSDTRLSVLHVSVTFASAVKNKEQLHVQQFINKTT